METLYENVSQRNRMVGFIWLKMATCDGLSEQGDWLYHNAMRGNLWPAEELLASLRRTVMYGASCTWHAPVSHRVLNVFVHCRSCRWVGWAAPTAPTDIVPHLLRGTGWQPRDVTVLVPARALDCLVRTSVPTAPACARHLVGPFFLMLSDVTSAFDAVSFNMMPINPNSPSS